MPQKFKPTPMQANTDTDTDVPVDRFGRPLKDAQGRWITYPGDENPGCFVVKHRNTDKSESGDMSAARKADRYKEQYLKSGNTSDLLKYQREHKKAMGYSTDESEDMSAARQADHYKEQYLKSGKTSDLLKYQREHKKAMGY